MVFLSLVPNVIPLLFTAGIMGFTGIPIKASTILVFSIAFGISVDNTIHFLAKYRQELRFTNWNIGKSVVLALRETGFSMIYTSFVLFFGFGIFSLSSFGGTVALGVLVSLTLLVALISNLILLPALLLGLQRRATTRYFEEPFLEIFDEEEDIEQDELRIEGRDKNGNPVSETTDEKDKTIDE
jgi:predicted RND superfamily exporter protein